MEGLPVICSRVPISGPTRKNLRYCSSRTGLLAYFGMETSGSVAVRPEYKSCRAVRRCDCHYRNYRFAYQQVGDVAEMRVTIGRTKALEGLTAHANHRPVQDGHLRVCVATDKFRRLWLFAHHSE
jgi:hypothetical protein